MMALLLFFLRRRWSTTADPAAKQQTAADAIATALAPATVTTIRHRFSTYNDTKSGNNTKQKNNTKEGGTYVRKRGGGGSHQPSLLLVWFLYYSLLGTPRTRTFVMMCLRFQRRRTRTEDDDEDDKKEEQQQHQQCTAYGWQAPNTLVRTKHVHVWSQQKMEVDRPPSFPTDIHTARDVARLYRWRNDTGAKRGIFRIQLIRGPTPTRSTRTSLTPTGKDDPYWGCWETNDNGVRLYSSSRDAFNNTVAPSEERPIGRRPRSLLASNQHKQQHPHNDTGSVDGPLPSLLFKLVDVFVFSRILAHQLWTLSFLYIWSSIQSSIQVRILLAKSDRRSVWNRTKARLREQIGDGRWIILICNFYNGEIQIVR